MPYPSEAERRPVVASRAGVVAAAHPLAAAAGAGVLARGGNAFDAAVATAAALGVVEPFMSGPAGFGAATCWAAGDGRMRSLDFSPRAPLAWAPGAAPPREARHIGPLAVAAGSALAGWCDLLSAHGTRRFAEVLAPAVTLAREGVPLVPSTAARINQALRERRDLPGFDDWAAIYAPGGREVHAGQVLHQPDLADTLEAAGEAGPRLFATGAIAERIATHLAGLGGVLTAADFAAVSPDWQRPLRADYRDLTLHVPAPPGQAFQLLLTLRLLEATDFAALERNGVAHLDAVWRAARLAAGERIALGSPDAEAVETALGEENVARLRARLADPAPLEGPMEQAGGPAPEGHTTSLAVADRAGNLVALTQSLGAPFGSGIVVPGTGLVLNNALFWGEAATLQPGEGVGMPLAPTVATRAGRGGPMPVLALGTPGSYGICPTLAQTLVQYRDFGLPLQQAVEAPRARLYDGRRVVAEGRLAPETLEGLRAQGHVVVEGPAWTPLVGGVQAVARDPSSGIVTGAADPRREGLALAG